MKAYEVTMLSQSAQNICTLICQNPNYSHQKKDELLCKALDGRLQGEQPPDAVVIKLTESHTHVRCPHCGNIHWHGAWSEPGSHRVSHCGAEGGYYIAYPQSLLEKYLLHQNQFSNQEKEQEDG